MSHVDEGALHAYLDGALDEYPPSEAERIRDHLDRCAECVDRLEAERRIRGDAHAFLDMASPTVEAPSFEELRAYVRRTRPARRGISHLQRLGWAASVVLALGAGWMLREGQLQAPALEARQDRVLTPTSGAVVEAPARRTATERRADDGGWASPSLAEVETPPVLAVDRAASSAGAAVEAPASAETVQVLASEREDPAGLGEQVAAGGDPASGVAASGDPADADSLPAGEAALERTMLSANVVAEAEYAADAAASDSAPAAEAVVERPAVESTEASVQAPVPSEAPAGSTAAAGRAMDASVMTSELRQEALAPTAARRAAAREADDSTTVALLAVPGYAVTSVTNLGNGSTAWGVRVLQEMADGETFEVFHLEPGVDLSILPDPAPGRNEARLETAEGWIVARGALSEAELTGMLQRLFPEGR